MKKIITSGAVAAVAMLGIVSPVFAATPYQPIHASSTTKMHVSSTTPITRPKITPMAKVVLLVGTVGQNSTGLLTAIVKTKTYNITVGSTVLIYNKAGKTITQSSIKTGDQIRVRGLATGTQVTATSMRDLSL